MKAMLCRNRVENYSKWREIFDANTEGGRVAGLHLMNMWRSVEDPNNVFFVFQIDDVDKARAFIESPEAAETGRASGVIDGECHFLESVPGY